MNRWLNKFKGAKEFLDAKVAVRDYERVFEECLQTEIVVVGGKDLFQTFKVKFGKHLFTKSL